MKLPKILIGLVMVLSLAACQINPINPALQYESKPGEAVVLVEINSPIPIESIALDSGKKYSTDPSLSQASLTRNLVYKDTIAIPAKVGENFSVKSVNLPTRVIGSVITTSGYTFQGPVLKVEQSGIYFYGSYLWNGQGLVFTNRLTEDMLGRAKNTFYQNFRQLKTLNFSWPKASLYSNYQISRIAQNSLKSAVQIKVNSVNISTVDGIDMTCRLARQTIQIDGLPVEKYVESALTYELKAGDKFDSKSGKSIQGVLNKFTFSTFSDASITLGMEFKIDDQVPFYVESTYRYEGSLRGETACRLVAEQIPSATRNFLEDVFISEKFKAAFRS